MCSWNSFMKIRIIRIHLIRIRIQNFRLNTDPDPDPIWIQGFTDQKLEKNYNWKKFNFFGSKTTIYLSLGLHKPSKLQKKPSAFKREDPALQTWNFLIFFYFCGSFLPSWIRARIRIPNTDPGPHQLTRLNPETIRIRICNLDENGKVLKLRADVEVWLVIGQPHQQPNSTLSTLCTSQPRTGNGWQIYCCFLNDFEVF